MASIEVRMDFNPETDCWSGAVNTVKTLDDDELQQVLDIAFGDYEEVPTDTEVNDFLWFETDTIADWLGYEDWEQLEKVKSGDTFWKDGDDYYDESDINEMYQDALENEEIEEGDYDDAEDWADYNFERIN